MMTIKRGLICFALLLFCAASFLGCGGGAVNGGGDDGPIPNAVNGLVVDPLYAPISGATVVAGTQVVSTRSDGTFIISNLSSGTYVITVSAPGYTTSYRKITYSGGSLQVPLVVLTLLDSKSVLLGTVGGNASNTDGSIKLAVPSGALSSSTPVSLTRVEIPAAPYPPPAGEMFVAVIAYIAPPTGTLSSSAEISLPNSTGISDGTSIPFYVFNIVNCEWELISDAFGTAHNTVGRIDITAWVRTFGWIAAIVPYAPNLGNITGTVYDVDTNNVIPFAYVWYSSFSTVANSSGVYVLSDLPTGEATIEAIAAGYTKGSTRETVTVGTKTANIHLNSISNGTVTGNIYDVTHVSQGVPGARVVVDSSGGPAMETVTDIDGDYTLYSVPYGSLDVYVYASGYLSRHLSGYYLEPNEIEYIDVGLTPTDEVVTWVDSFESDRGWQNIPSDLSCQWRRKQDPQTIKDSLHPTYVSLPDAGYLPTPHLGTYCYWFGVTMEGSSPEGTYIGIQNLSALSPEGGETLPGVLISGKLQSPVIDLSAFAYASLSFWTWWEIECINVATGYDLMIVEIASDPYTTWNTVGILNPTKDPDESQRQPKLPYSSGGFNAKGAWVRHSYNLTPYVGNRIKMRFRFDSKDTHYNGFRGWFIDDVEVKPEQISGFGISETAVERRPDGGGIRSLSR